VGHANSGAQSRRTPEAGRPFELLSSVHGCSALLLCRVYLHELQSGEHLAVTDLAVLVGVYGVSDHAIASAAPTRG